MSDLLEHIAEHEDTIAREWSKEIASLGIPVYTRLNAEQLAGAVRRSCQALLRLMQDGETDTLEQMLRQTAKARMAEGMSFGETVAVWLLYRQAIQAALRKQLQEGDNLEQMIDRVDPALNWILAVLRREYQEAGM